MCVQSDEEEEVELEGTFGAAAAVKDAQVSSLHKKCVELALLPRTVFGAYETLQLVEITRRTKNRKNLQKGCL